MVHLIASLIVLAFLGIADSAYLAWKHFRKQPLVCPIGDKCEAVTESKWSTIFGIRNEILGILYYIAILVGAFLIFYNYRIENYLLIFSGFGLAYSIFLTYIQSRIIKSYCFYCLVSAFLSLLILLNVLLL